MYGVHAWLTMHVQREPWPVVHVVAGARGVHTVPSSKWPSSVFTAAPRVDTVSVISVLRKPS